MKINTVTGTVDTSELGVTLMHEHIYVLSSSFCQAFPDWCDKEEVATRFAANIARLKKYGMNTFVEVTPINHGRDIHAIRHAAELAGINVLATTGLYFNESPWMQMTVDPDYLAKLYIREITEGIEDTDIKAAAVKCATDMPYGLSESNKAMITATGLAALETGVPVIAHANPHEKFGIVQTDMLTKMGVDAHRIMICHAFSSNDMGYVEELLNKGVYVGCDQLNFTILNSYENLAKMVGELCKKGFEDQIFLSHDAASVSDFGFCLTPGARDAEQNILIGDYSKVFEVIPEFLKAEGVTQAQIDKMLTENPRRYFEQLPLRA